MKCCAFFSRNSLRKKRLLRQFLRTRIIRKEVKQFIPENSSTTRFEDNERNTASDLAGQNIQNPSQQSFCAIEQTKVVERTSATKIFFRQQDAKSRRFEDVHRGLSGRRMKVVVKSIGPEKNVRNQSLVVRRWPLANDQRRRTNDSLLEPVTKSLPRKRRNAPLLRHPSDELGKLAQQRKLCSKIGDAGKVGSEPRPDVDVGEA